MKATVLTVQFEATSTTLATVKGLLDTMNIKYSEKSYEWEEAPKAETRTEEPKKAERKATTSKKSAPKKTSTKSSSDFDRDLYLELGKKFGVLTKHGIAKFARPAIYDAMSEIQKSKSGKLTKKAETAIRKELVGLAAKGGEAWMMDMVTSA